MQCPRIPSQLSESVHHQLNMYALAAGAAGVGMLAVAQFAEARIVYTPAHKTIPFCTGNQDLCFKLDLNHDGVTDFRIIRVRYGNAYALSIHPSHIPTHNRIWGKPDGSYRLASALNAGFTIGPNSFNFEPLHYSMWASNGSKSHGQWKKVRNKYLGLKFYAQGKVHYGWARLSTTPNTVLTGYAYETTPGKSIKAGQTKGGDEASPETGTLGALARGAR